MRKIKKYISSGILLSALFFALSIPHDGEAYHTHVPCSVTTCVVSVTTTSLKSTSGTKTISGTADGLTKLFIKLYRESDNSLVYTSKTVTVRNEKWKVKIPSSASRKIKSDSYRVEVYSEKKKDAVMLVSSTLVVGTQNNTTQNISVKSSSLLVVEPVPLLFGGTARAGDAVSVAYVQVINVGKEEARIEGFTLTQNGSASVDALQALRAVDDSGLIQGSTESTSVGLQFKNGSAFVPIQAVFAPGQMRLFTIKAVVKNDTARYAGTQLQINLASAHANASLKGMFPMYGTTWTIQ
ncbi:hypothetical protein K2X96_00195 [Patescibacteria group bacterium]|nr:hypothetical protein [Patescibacteria group bacterium]